MLFAPAPDGEEKVRLAAFVQLFAGVRVIIYCCPLEVRSGPFLKGEAEAVALLSFICD